MKRKLNIKRRKELRVFIILLSFLFFSTSFALDFGIKPIRIFINPGKNTAVFEIQSLTDKKITVETEIKEWDQDENGNDILKDTEEMIVVPPYIELEGKQKQLVRIAYLSAPPKDKQKTFRLLLKQLPKEIKIKEKPKKIQTFVQVVLHISVPVFVNPINTDLYYDLKFEKVKVSDKEVVLYVENKGNAFSRIVSFSLLKGNKEIYSNNMVKYILPDKKIKLVIKKVGKDKKEKPFGDVPDKVKFILEDGKEITVNL